jgi:prepilin-type processing-associated H-X9-DG protein
MSISVTCDCGRHIQAPESIAGSLVRCPDCGCELTVPKLALPSEELFDSWESGKTATSGKAVASLAMGVLFFFACLSGVPAIILGRGALRDIKRSKGRLGGRRIAIAGIVLGVFGCLFTFSLVLPAFRSAGEAARRAQCTNNLKQIGLALNSFHEAKGGLPAAAIADLSGKPLLSWRVAILPYLESSGLYAKFHLDEPWDSPHNIGLLQMMPPVYACPSDKTLKPGMTGYLVVIGPSTVFTPDFKPLRFQDIADGRDRTLLVGESRRSVPWTKPEDLSFEIIVTPSGLGSFHGYHNNGFNALFGDGSMRFIKSSIAPSVMRALVTRNGNEVLSSDSY